MKKLIIVFAFFVFTSNCFSQVGIGVGTGGFGVGMNIPINKKTSQRSNHLENQVREMKHDLDLNDDQVVKVRGLLIERDRMHQQGSKMSNQDFDKRMQEILTPDQLPKYNELKQRKRQERKEGKKENKKEPLPESQWDDVYM